jgi:hypothetical protein
VLLTTQLRTEFAQDPTRRLAIHLAEFANWLSQHLNSSVPPTDRQTMLHHIISCLLWLSVNFLSRLLDEDKNLTQTLYMNDMVLNQPQAECRNKYETGTMGSGGVAWADMSEEDFEQSHFDDHLKNVADVR